MSARKMLLLPPLVFTLYACGGGSDDSVINPGVPVPAEPMTGIFLDSPVINVDYTNTTGTRSGTTNASGEFTFVSGDSIIFSIGDLEFPTIRAAETVTPMDMANTLNTSDPKVTNIVRLLLTLDQDADPANGITITDTAKAVATQVDFLLSETDFESSSAVTNLIFNAGQDTVVSSLVTSAEAITHFEAQLTANNIDFGTVDQKNDAAILQYLADNNLQATKDESGMYYEIITEGTGDSPTSSSTVEVRYKGTLLDGTIFDQTTGDTTAEFSLASVIDGWQIALPFLKPGGEGVFYLPSSLAYGSQGSGTTIPPDAVLIFEIELVSFQ